MRGRGVHTARRHVVEFTEVPRVPNRSIADYFMFTRTKDCPDCILISQETYSNKLIVQNESRPLGGVDGRSARGRRETICWAGMSSHDRHARAERGAGGDAEDGQGT